MKMLREKKTVLIFFLLFVADISYANGLGRLFTNQDERNRLNAIRDRIDTMKKEKEDITDNIKSLEEFTRQEKSLDSEIKLKGVVYREDGKNTVWINDSNTFDGDLESQHIEVHNNGVEPDQVEIFLSDKIKKIKLKVGESYTANAKEEYSRIIK